MKDKMMQNLIERICEGHAALSVHTKTRFRWEGWRKSLIFGGVVFSSLLNLCPPLAAQKDSAQVYDKHGHLLKSLNPGGISWVFQYDAQGHVIGARNSRGQRLSFKVKPAQRPSRKILNKKAAPSRHVNTAARTYGRRMHETLPRFTAGEINLLSLTGRANEHLSICIRIDWCHGYQGQGSHEPC